MVQVAKKEPIRPCVFRPDLNLELEAMVLKALAKNADDRFTSMGEWARALESFLETAPVGEQFSQTAIPVRQNWQPDQKTIIKTPIGGPAPTKIESFPVAGNKTQMGDLQDEEEKTVFAYFQNNPILWAVGAGSAFVFVLVLVLLLWAPWSGDPEKTVAESAGFDNLKTLPTNTPTKQVENNNSTNNKNNGGGPGGENETGKIPGIPNPIPPISPKPSTPVPKGPNTNPMVLSPGAQKHQRVVFASSQNPTIIKGVKFLFPDEVEGRNIVVDKVPVMQECQMDFVRAPVFRHEVTDMPHKVHCLVETSAGGRPIPFVPEGGGTGGPSPYVLARYLEPTRMVVVSATFPFDEQLENF